MLSTITVQDAKSPRHIGDEMQVTITGDEMWVTKTSPGTRRADFSEFICHVLRIVNGQPILGVSNARCRCC